MAEALQRHRSLTALRMVHNGLDAATLETAIGTNTRLKVLAVQSNPLPNYPLTEVAKLVGTSPNLSSLQLANCRLRPPAALALADALATSAARGLHLAHLDLSSNQLDSQAGHALAGALQGNSRLTGLDVSHNPMDKEAYAAIHRAKETVAAAWYRTAEGRAQARQAKCESRAGIGDTLEAVLHFV